MDDEFSREVISGYAANVDEVAAAINRFREAVQTVPMFGGRRVVWLKDVNFLADSVDRQGRGHAVLVEDLQRLLESVDPEAVGVLITAAPIDRRRAFAKWCEKNADFALAGGEPGEDALAGVVEAEARALGASFDPGAVDLLLAKVGANTRLLVEEVRKLADLRRRGRTDRRGRRRRADAQHRRGRFLRERPRRSSAATCPGPSTPCTAISSPAATPRPIIAALQNRNRAPAAGARAGGRRRGPAGPARLEGLAAAAGAYRARYAEAAGEKSSYNIFTPECLVPGQARRRRQAARACGA